MSTLNSLQDETGAATEAVVDKDEEIALLVDVFTIVLAIDAYAPEVKALREPGIAVTAMEAAKTLADADQKPAKPPKVNPVISGRSIGCGARTVPMVPRSEVVGTGAGQQAYQV
jgi:hypothetical protein